MADHWTAETEELTAMAIHQAACYDDWDECWAERQHARTVEGALTALAEKGLLVVPGGEVREEWRVSHLNPAGRDTWSNARTRIDAMRELEQAKHESRCGRTNGEPDRWRELQVDRRTVTSWPDGAELTTPWREVDGD